jgi:putative mRNA 3-end processing factor
MRQPPIELHRGELRVAGTALHLDAQRRAACAFVSHAHGDHIGRHDRTIATPATLALMNHRLGEPKRSRQAEQLPVGYRQPFGLGVQTLELFSAGHVLGSAQLRVTLEDGRTLGYSGDLCTDTPYAAAPAEVMRCDVLVLESTFGLPRYVFPPKEETLAAVRRFCDDALSDGVTPVLYGYALGKSQEILAFLAGAGYACRCHPVVHAINRIYEAHGVALPGVRPLDAEGVAAGEVVVVPQQLAWSPAMRSVRRRRTAALTGWAIDGDRMFKGVDAAFPLSDHCDYPSLLAYARATGAGRIFTVHGHADPLAAALCREGIRAEPLREGSQLELL